MVINEPHHRIPPGFIEEVREHLLEMMHAGAIRDSEIPYSSNVVKVQKKDGSICFYVDFRKLNNHIKYFSKLDLCCGY